MIEQRFFQINDISRFPDTDGVGRMVDNDQPSEGKWHRWLQIGHRTVLLADDETSEVFLTY